MSLRTLHHHLLAQISSMPAADQRRVAVLIERVDESGYLTDTIGSISRSAPRGVSAAELEVALTLLQSLQPSGVGARDLKECLLLQVKGDDTRARHARILIQSHLEALNDGAFETVSKRSALSVSEVMSALDLVKSLTPKPGMGY